MLTINQEAEYHHLPRDVGYSDVSRSAAPATSVALFGNGPADVKVEPTISARLSPTTFPVTPTKQTKPGDPSSCIVLSTRPSSFPVRTVFTKIPRPGKAPTITFYGGSWIELRCHICNGNWSTKQQKFAYGIDGMQAHIQRDHVSEPTDVATVVRLCKVRDVPMD